tara:strand:- start:45505 stop:47514 length:2010 start_codon:yes stop_codon:yes gene_type:complete
MAGISISELINKEDTIDVPNGFIPISINDNTFKIKASTFLQETTNRTNNFETIVEQQSATITQCITDTVSLCASIECNDTDITNLQSNITNIYSCLTDLSGCVDVRSCITEIDILRNTVENNSNAINNVRTRFTTLSSCVDTINGDLLLKASASSVDNLLSQVNSLDSCVETESNKIVDIQSQINALDVCGNAIAVDCLNQRITKNETDICNNGTSICTIDGRISTLDGRVNATATAECVNGLESRITVTEGVAEGAASSVTSINNEITTINGTLSGKANSSVIESLASSIATESSKVTSLQTLTANLQTQITNIDVSSQGSAIATLQSQASTADSNITQLQTDKTTLDSCISCIDGCITGQASSISTLTTNVNTINGSGTGSITSVCSLITNANSDITCIKAKYGVQLNTNNIVSGFCLNSSGGSSDFIIQADCFILADQTNSNCGSPFSVINNCVRMCGACIKDLSVDTLQIGEQAISSCSASAGNDKRFSVGSMTSKTDTTPLGEYVNLATATIVSLGCPTAVSIGYGGTLLKTARTAVRCDNVSGRNGTNMCRMNSATFSYEAQVRVLRGSTVLPATNTSTFFDDNPGTGSVTYKLQARFIRNYGNITIDRCSASFTFGKSTSGGNITTTTCTLLRCMGNVQSISPSTQTITITDPFIEVRQNKR